MADFPEIRSYPWTAAFVSFCHGMPMEDIATTYDIPFKSVRQKASVEQWVKHRANLPLTVQASVDAIGNQAVAAPSGSPVESALTIGNAKLKAMLENRATNLKVWERLREVAIKQIEALAEGKLKVQKVFCFKGMVVTHDAAPGPGDWVNIATFLQTISQGTYRALGDFQGPEKGQDAAAGALNTPAAPAVTIILPAAISAPREERQVFDLQHVKVETSPK